MKQFSSKRIAPALCLVALLNLTFSPHLLAADASGDAQPDGVAAAFEMAPRAIDTSLDTAGGLQGTLVDMRGVPFVKTPVVLLQQGNIVSRAVTTKDGRFYLKDVPSGASMIQAKGSEIAVRTWDAAVSPPGAMTSILFVAPGEIVSGQYVPLKNHMSRPLSLALFAGIAIGVPVALHTIRENRRPGS